ncbi:hypothetical protein CEUSTIGMA_g2088.t1 [Chlamydomonas eustigma]|uniref:Uncharacterized protein n=1 Tax=Chlamydomonas eustigma TaxID=1157962 RepID=A0A250WVT1_9CHLO|nr:hypothetical protein CEUSTIGMA_g2088.t1 [Chlamydomonas eustigma]|eukprot:GAX74640.1 hypothetical protein CEUSTIGMA_g2088.t1 [Chlamydomonas eustigma]
MHPALHTVQEQLPSMPLAELESMEGLRAQAGSKLGPQLVTQWRHLFASCMEIEAAVQSAAGACHALKTLQPGLLPEGLTDERAACQLVPKEIPRVSGEGQVTREQMTEGLSSKNEHQVLCSVMASSSSGDQRPPNQHQISFDRPDKDLRQVMMVPDKDLRQVMMVPDKDLRQVMMVPDKDLRQVMMVPDKDLRQVMMVPVFASISMVRFWELLWEVVVMMTQEASVRSSLCMALEPSNKAATSNSVAAFTAQAALVAVQAPMLETVFQNESEIHLKLSAYKIGTDTLVPPSTTAAIIGTDTLVPPSTTAAIIGTDTLVPPSTREGGGAVLRSMLTAYLTTWISSPYLKLSRIQEILEALTCDMAGF